MQEQDIALRAFKDVTGYRLTVVTNINFNDIDINSSKIKYKKPDGSAGEFTTQQLAGGEQYGKIYIDFDSSHKLDSVGVWVFWSEVTLSDNRTLAGNIFRILVRNQGEE